MEAAALNCRFVVLHILLTLDPELINRAAEASATKAIKSVYSIRSCPRSSRQSVCKETVITTYNPKRGGSDQDIKRYRCGTNLVADGSRK